MLTAVEPPHDDNASGPYARLLASRAGRAIVALFCAFYVFSIGVYSLPSDTSWGPARWMTTHAGPWIGPPVLLASQWQQWNLFSPNPLRRVTLYRVEAFSETRHKVRHLITLRPGVFPWWRHANHFKLLINIMEGSGVQVAERYVQGLCVPYALEPGTELKVTYLVSIIPYLETPQPAGWWRAWKMAFTPNGGFSAVCPDPPVTPLTL